VGFLAVGYHLSYTYDNQGCNHGWKVEGTKVWVPTPGRLLGVGCERGRSPLLWGCGCITPGKFLKTQMLNPGFLDCLLWNFLLFENYGQEVGGPTQSWPHNLEQSTSFATHPRTVAEHLQAPAEDSAFPAAVIHCPAPLWLISEFGAVYKYSDSTQLNSP